MNEKEKELIEKFADKFGNNPQYWELHDFILKEVVERDENILNVWGYLIQLQKATENENTEASVDEWNLIESIKEKIDDLFDVKALKGGEEKE